MAEKAWKACYGVLLVLRLLCAIRGTGYIHPDEWFQSGEAIAGIHSSTSLLRTWEFDAASPSRSLASLHLFQFPLVAWVHLNCRFGVSASSYSLFLAQRATSFFTSLTLDFVAARLVAPSTRQRLQTYKTLCILGSSHAVLSLCTRPFSNGAEAALLALCLLLTRAVVGLSHAESRAYVPVWVARQSWIRYCSALFCLGAAGLFVRFTFVAFALPCAAYVAVAGIRLCRRQSILSTAALYAYLLLETLPSFVFVVLLHICTDSKLYRGKWFSSPLLLAPINLLRYNLDPQNLAEHGTHPRWLHVVVNAPIVLGASVWLYGALKISLWAAGRKVERRKKVKGKAKEIDVDAAVQLTMRKIYLATVLVPIALLSVQPHQEPRFLLPTVLPSTLLFAEACFGEAHRRMQMGRRTRRLLLSLYLLQHAVLTILFSFLHHGAVLPTLFNINNALSGRKSAGWLPLSDHTGPASPTASLHIIFWRTFMPPRHLILPLQPRGSSQGGSQTRYPTISDHGSMPARTLAAWLRSTGRTLSTSPNQSREELEAEDDNERHIAHSRQLVVAPTWALADLERSLDMEGEQRETDLVRLATFGPQVDLDHLAEVMTTWRREAGWASLKDAASIQLVEFFDVKQAASVHREPPPVASMHTQS
ncbi:Putative alpha 1,2 mannosyltransferase [Ceraceosorus bombacis]|uniref:Mannosyltransferase n=1 Tax=Ceraceosorus bombacis TaxID=401625 RepID=A0A0N7L8T6_9BASI|nr:Putative alpha 1,2 mannosyltransferase [Ceraceosorus bombacis]